MTDRPEPSDRVFGAFGVGAAPRERLAGGRGLTWRAGPVVLRRAIAGLDRPAFIDTSDDPWARADRMVWDGEPLPDDPTLERLAAGFRPVASPSQVIHGDLLGNVLFAAGRPPTIIDWAPYWRPAGLGAAIAVADAVCWYGTPIGSMPDLGRGVAEWGQLLVRALAFRIATLHLIGAWDSGMAERHAPVVAAIA